MRSSISLSQSDLIEEISSLTASVFRRLFLNAVSVNSLRTQLYEACQPAPNSPGALLRFNVSPPPYIYLSRLGNSSEILLFSIS